MAILEKSFDYSSVSMHSTPLFIAKKVLETETIGLQALASALNEEFVRAVELLSQVKGRVIVSGIGKSGHIARKIAATLSSTGTPAFFVHSGEASHGDLGMLTKNDILLLLSKSGSNNEIKDIIYFAKRFSIPIIAIVGKKDSLLAEHATVCLLLPNVPEASKVSAPTTSAVMMLALGDCLAITVCEQKGFNSDDFHLLHPGGRLGKSFIKVSELMHQGEELPLINTGTCMPEALTIMTDKKFGCVGVVDEKGRLLGIITDGDIRRHLSPHFMTMTVEEVMTANPKTIAVNALAVESLHLMEKHAITALFITDSDGIVQGLLHIHDCLRAGLV